MKKLMVIIVLILLSACDSGQTDENMVFDAIVVDRNADGITLREVDEVQSFDLATSSYQDPSIEKGMVVTVEAKAEIRESYPVQITVVAIEEKEKDVVNVISAKVAEKMMKEDVIILDVREEDEYNEGHIANSILVPYQNIEENIAKLPSDKDQIILVYCRSGRRSNIAANELVERGYHRVYDFGGIEDWPGDIVFD